MTIKWGIIAPGIIAHSFAESMKSVKNSEIVAVGSRSIKRAEEFAKKHNVNRFYGSYEELCKDENVDIVYIASPHNFHKEQAHLAMDNGKAVLCEKPVTVNHDECLELVKKSKNKNLFFMEAQWMRFMPIINEIKKRIKNGVIGDILRIEVDFSYKADFDPESRLFNPNLAGGALLDIGVYPISFSLYLLDKLPITFVGECSVGTSEVDEHGSVIFKFDDNENAVCTFGTRVDGSRKAIIRGSKGRVEINSEFYMATEADIITDKGSETIKMPHRSHGYEWEIEAVNSCLKKDLIESPTMSHQDSLDQMSIMDELRKRWGIKYPFE